MGVIVIDCRAADLAGAADFWSAALGFEADPDPEFPDYVALRTPDGHIGVLLQSVDHESRLHMDIETDDREAERDRLTGLGATVVREVDEDGKHWTVLEAPTGHRFCLIKPRSSSFAVDASQWKES